MTVMKGGRGGEEKVGKRGRKGGEKEEKRKRKRAITKGKLGKVLEMGINRE